MFGKKKHIAADSTVNIAPQINRVERRVPEIITLAHTATGNRKYQQDAVYVTPGQKLAANKKTRVFAAVCDGMGGMTDGGLASGTAIKMLAEGFEEIRNQPVVDVPAFFIHKIKEIDQVINSIPKERGKGSGTTMVAVVAEGNHLYWGSVGDSRLYILRGSDMIQVTRDHNYMLHLQMMVESGQMTWQEAQSKKQKEALISFLGMGNVSLMDVNQKPFEMQFGDVVLLCSDGITKTLPDHQIRDILCNDAVSMKEKAKILVEAAVRENTHQYIESKITKR